MYTVYILYSKSLSRYYIGHCQNLLIRLTRHNRGLVKSTKSGVPWNIIYTVEYSSKQEAYKREMQIKSYKRGRAFKKLIK